MAVQAERPKYRQPCPNPHNGAIGVSVSESRQVNAIASILAGLAEIKGPLARTRERGKRTWLTRPIFTDFAEDFPQL